MGTKYGSGATISGFNSSPPSDDGSVSASNQLQWSKHLDKIGTPLKNLAESINTKLVAFTDFGSRSVTVSDSTVASDHMKTVEIASTATTGVTISLGDAATMTAGYIVSVENLSVHTQTVALITATDTLEGKANGSFLLRAKGSLTFKVNASANGYYSLSNTGFQTSYVGTSSGTNTLTATSDRPLTAYAIGQRFSGIAGATNTGASTLNISSLGAGAVQAGGSALVGGELRVNAAFEVLVTATTPVFELLGPRFPQTLGTVQTSTTGTSIDFTGIPPWATRIQMTLVGVSVDAATTLAIQIGDSGGIETSGYLGGVVGLVNAAGIVAENPTGSWRPNTGAASTVHHGIVIITLHNAATFTWTCLGVLGRSDIAAVDVFAGSKSTSAALDRVRLTTASGTANFNAGSVNILYS